VLLMKLMLFKAAYIALECMGTKGSKKAEIPMIVQTMTGIQCVEITLQIQLNAITCLE
jgi:hypothetical protein